MSATATRSFRWLFWTLALLGLALDQGSKYGIYAWLYPGPREEEKRATVVEKVFYLQSSYTFETEQGEGLLSSLRTVSGERLPKVNHGALWGIGGRVHKEDENGEVRESSDLNHIFAVVSVAAAAAIMVWSFRRATAQDRWLCVALGLILAGTLGNLYDRVVFSGVRDFLAWVYLYDFPVFNIADSCLVCGATLLLVQAFFAVPEDRKKAEAAVVQQTVELNHEAQKHPEACTSQGG
jgi:lipoprotein signal peptidase